MRVLRAVSGIFFATMVAAPTAVADCLCGEGESSFFYALYDIRDEEVMEEYPWSVRTIEPTFDIILPDEPIVGCYVRVKLVTEDHPGVMTFDMKFADEAIHVFGTWMSFSEFEAWALMHECQLPVS